jgi:phenylacetate-CoA ligase
MTCPEAGRLHLDSGTPLDSRKTNRCLYEIINGELVTTDLFNYVMLLVSYKCGDILELESKPCSCGRPGLTAKVLGRVEDKIRTFNGLKYPGQITMPSLPGILNYQVVRQQEKGVEIWIQPQPTQDLVFEPLVDWTESTFGKVSAQVLFSDIEVINSTLYRKCKDKFWTSVILKALGILA